MKRLSCIVFIGFFLSFTCPSIGSDGAAAGREPTPVSVRHNVRAAYEVTHDKWEHGVAAGLYTIKSQLGFYKKMGVSPDELNLHAVFHADAGYFLLADKAYNKQTNTGEGNSNKEIIRELTDAGVHIDLCSQTMKHNSWTAEDILPVVTIVVDAYSRLVDLQLQGFSYVKF